ncbi:tRNA (guanosine(37)-N1)-methyltransferase TrmD [Botrimarina sp.]|uniref:tRNA (guanosine(37)-N1)-methyltransferase TrmD n=1 Tax=Botrimarina sp. TaxID=2795802 RepID=UPI0032EAF5C0
MRFDVLTLFPEIFSGYLTQSLLKLAIDRGLTSVHLHNIRDWAEGKHKQVDDKPFGGGPGMLLMAGPVVEAVEAVQAAADAPPGRLLLMSPQGRRLDQSLAEELSTSNRLVLLCGRYEGFDQRVVDLLRPEEISIGDYVLNGGEVAAMTIIDSVVRLVPGVLGDETSNQEDSFSRAGRTLEYAQYTRPREYRGLSVPDVLLSGNHPEIAAWREADAARRTAARLRAMDSGLQDSAGEPRPKPEA